MSNTGSHFTDNIVFYDNKKPSTMIELVECGIRIIATQRVRHLFGRDQTIIHRSLPGFPESEPIRLVATSLTRWTPGETIVVTGESISQPRTWHRLPPSKGPFSSDNGKRLELKGTDTNQIAIFQEKVDN